MKNRFFIFLLPLLLGACVQLGDSPVKPANDGETVPVALSLSVAAVEDGMPGSKADIYHEPEDPAFDADAAIKTVLLLQFDGEDTDAQLIGQQQYFDHWPLVAAQGEGFALVARSTPQTVVVIANTFGYLPLTDRTTLGNFLENENHSVVSVLSNVWYEVEDGGDRHHYLQMGGHHTFPSVTASTAMNLTLRRNCAKVIINVTNEAFDKTGDNKVIVEDVRLCNINKKHYYVTDFSQSAGDAIDFEDKFSNMYPMRFDAPEEVFAANDGSTQTFTYYIPANLRGLGANTDAAASQKGKNLGAPLGATCFRIYAHYGDNEEPIVYTYYLGGDLVNDFDLKPNTKYSYNITITGKGTPANDYRIEDLGDRLTFKVDANCYMLQPPTLADKSLTYTIPVRRVAVFWNPAGYDMGVYSASGGDNEVLTLTEATEWTVGFVWNDIYDGNVKADEGELLVGSVDDGSGKYVFSGKGFDPDYAGAAVAGHDPFFRIRVKTGMQGSALVALKNAAGVILWSWHLWVTDYNPDVPMTPVDGTYVYPVAGGALHRYAGAVWGAGKAYENAFIMDRNLGALTDNPGVRNSDTYGCYYQFGRKDPFPTTGGVPAREAGSTENIRKSIHNPTLFLTSVDRWTAVADGTLILGSEQALWNDPRLEEHGGDNCEAGKSIYDPCPPGWQVPRNDTWSNCSASTSEWFSSPAGRYYYPQGDAANGRIWYPAAGIRHRTNGAVQYTDRGFYWTSYPSSNRPATLNFTSTSMGANSDSIVHGMPVRCVRSR